ncbi:MAG: DCC1-like thiol-disulfide oxidoreductase family protein [Vicinamibacterales bacterium]
MKRKNGNSRGIVLYDGTCLFCHASMRFIARHDKAGYFRFGAAQDPRARLLLDGRGLGDISASTIVLIEHNRVYLRSTAALRIARRLGLPWSLMTVFLIVPRAIRDVVYNIVSTLRYRIADTTDSCEIPSEAIRQRMI